MCDYSLHSVRTRPAKIADRLVTTGFPGTVTRGFAAIDEPAMAICLRPGTEVTFDKDAQHGSFLGRWLPFLRRQRAGKVARFRQINGHRQDTHHDALEFADGTVVLVTRLLQGQRATILQLPKDSSIADSADDRKDRAGQLADVIRGH